MTKRTNGSRRSVDERLTPVILLDPRRLHGSRQERTSDSEDQRARLNAYRKGKSPKVEILSALAARPPCPKSIRLSSKSLLAKEFLEVPAEKVKLASD